MPTRSLPVAGRTRNGKHSVGKTGAAGQWLMVDIPSLKGAGRQFRQLFRTRTDYQP
jgi:hypothetical protein